MDKRKVTRKQFNEGVIGLIEYERQFKNSIVTRKEAERQLLQQVVVVESDNIRESNGKEFKPDFGLIGLTPDEAKIANGEPGNCNPQTMSNEDWSNIFKRSNRNDR